MTSGNRTILSHCSALPQTGQWFLWERKDLTGKFWLRFVHSSPSNKHVANQIKETCTWEDKRLLWCISPLIHTCRGLIFLKSFSWNNLCALDFNPAHICGPWCYTSVLTSRYMHLTVCDLIFRRERLPQKLGSGLNAIRILIRQTLSLPANTDVTLSKSGITVQRGQSTKRSPTRFRDIFELRKYNLMPNP